MTRKRRVFGAAFKARVALAAVRGDKTTAQLASEVYAPGAVDVGQNVPAHVGPPASQPRGNAPGAEVAIASGLSATPQASSIVVTPPATLPPTAGNAAPR